MKKYIAYIASDAGMILEGIFAEDFDDADEQAEARARNFAGGELYWVEEYNTGVRAEFDAVINLFGE